MFCKVLLLSLLAYQLVYNVESSCIESSSSCNDVHPDRWHPLPEDCGRITSTDSYRDQNPFVALLVYRSKRTHRNHVKCIGSVIHKNFVLTTAKCLSNSTRFELHSLFVGSLIGTSFPVDNKLMHPSFDIRSMTNNVGLVEMVVGITEWTGRVTILAFVWSVNVLI